MTRMIVENNSGINFLMDTTYFSNLSKKENLSLLVKLVIEFRKYITLIRQHVNFVYYILVLSVNFLQKKIVEKRGIAYPRIPSGERFKIISFETLPASLTSESFGKGNASSVLEMSENDSSIFSSFQSLDGMTKQQNWKFLNYRTFIFHNSLS